MRVINDIRRREVEWYKVNGNYQDRIKINASGLEYVIGDWSWNRNNQNRKEYVDRYMSKRYND